MQSSRFRNLNERKCWSLGRGRSTRMVLLLFVVLTAIVSVLFRSRTVWAAQTSSSSSESRDAHEATTDSPRGSVAAFLAHCKAGRFTDAARYLDLSRAEQSKGADYARMLDAVLARSLVIDLEKLSPDPKGNTEDGLPGYTDEIGRIADEQRKLQPVKLVRRDSAAEMHWVFSQGTISHIEDWYENLEDRWIRDRMPPSLLRRGPRDLLYWQWVAIPLLTLVVYVVGRIFAWLTKTLLGRVVRRTAPTWDDELLKRLGGPITFAWALGLFYLCVPKLALYPNAESFVAGVLRAFFFVVLFWAGTRVVGVVGFAMTETPWVKARPSALSAIPLLTRVGKISVVVLGVIAVLSQLGYPVTSLVAGLGIGGIALALAAQKTFENVFGSISISIDQPFRIGDFIKVEDVSGTVERIGLRSTRIRTLDRTVVTYPNGKLAELRVESFSVRDRIRLVHVLNLAYDTTKAKLDAILGEMEAYLRDHEKVWPSDIGVALRQIGSYSLDVEITAWFQTTDAAEFARIRQDILLVCVGIIERNGAKMAYPTRSVIVASASDGAIG